MLRLAVALYFVAAALADDSPVVDTASGPVRGFLSSSRSGRRYHTFTGIPFAKPPVGPLRFQPPEPADPWKVTKNATEVPMCIQYNMYDVRPKVQGVEDCLYLSVYTHDPKGKAPVMFHIFAGGFISGTAQIQPEYIMDEDVVVVAANYRVGIMGFLSFEDQTLPGNQGLKDQAMALRWVQRNIAYFGGDPDRVTIVGESAGGASVYHHTVSPMSRGLFHGAIAESGSSYNLWALMPPGLAKERTQKLAGLVSCPQSNTKGALDCMVKKDAKELVGHMEDFRVWQVDPLLLFQPVLETEGPGAFLTGPISRWQHSSVPLLIGTTAAEGLARTGLFISFDMDFKWFNDNFEKVAPMSLLYFASASDPDQVTRQIRQFYFGDKEITQGDWATLSNMYTDSCFAAGIMDAANEHSGDVYFYYFDYLGQNTFGPKNRSLDVGAAHVDEYIYLWKCYPLEGQDLDLSYQMVKIWTDFAKYGKAKSPNPKINWEKWTPTRHRYMHITNEGFMAQEGLHEDRYSFWSSLNYRDNFN